MGVVALNWIGFSIWNRELLFWGVLSGVIHGVYILCLSRAYNTQDISYVYPIARSAPVFVPVFAWLLLGEKLIPQTFIAILTIISAIYILHFDGHLIRGFKNLWQAIQHNDLRWAFYTLVMVVSYSLVDKKGMDLFLLQLPSHPFQNGIACFFLEATIGFTITGVAGFGGGLVVLPVLVWVFGIKEAIPIIAISQVFGTASRAWLHHRTIDWKVVRYFAVGSIPMSVIGLSLIHI